MKNIIKFLSLKQRVNKEGLRISRPCQGKLEEIVDAKIKEAIAKAKKEGASQLRPEHFE